LEEKDRDLEQRTPGLPVDQMVPIVRVSGSAPVTRSTALRGATPQAMT
jgi:hypothetical protein